MSSYYSHTSVVYYSLPILVYLNGISNVVVAAVLGCKLSSHFRRELIVDYTYTHQSYGHKFLLCSSAHESHYLFESYILENYQYTYVSNFHAIHAPSNVNSRTCLQTPVAYYADDKIRTLVQIIMNNWHKQNEHTHGNAVCRVVMTINDAAGYL